MRYRGYVLRLSNRNCSLIILFKIQKNFSKITLTLCWFRARAQRAASRGLFPNVGSQLGSTLLSLMFNYPCIWGAPRRATSPEFTLRPLFLLLDDRPGRAGSYWQLIRTAGALLRRRRLRSEWATLSRPVESWMSIRRCWHEFFAKTARTARSTSHAKIVFWKTEWI